MASRKRPSTRLHTMPTVERAVRVSCKWKTKPFFIFMPSQGLAHQSINSVIIIDHFSKNFSQFYLVEMPQFLLVHKASASGCDLECKQKQLTQCEISNIGPWGINNFLISSLLICKHSYLPLLRTASLLRDLTASFWRTHSIPMCEQTTNSSLVQTHHAFMIQDTRNEFLLFILNQCCAMFDT